MRKHLMIIYITEAVRKTKQLKEATDGEIEEGVAKYLRGAVDRKGGRKRRRTNDY